MVVFACGRVIFLAIILVVLSILIKAIIHQSVNFNSKEKNFECPILSFLLYWSNLQTPEQMHDAVAVSCHPSWITIHACFISMSCHHLSQHILFVHQLLLCHLFSAVSSLISQPASIPCMWPIALIKLYSPHKSEHRRWVWKLPQIAIMMVMAMSFNGPFQWLSGNA